MTATPAASQRPMSRAFEAAVHAAFAAGFLATLAVRLEPVAPALGDYSTERKAFEAGYLLRAHTWLCANDTNAQATAQAVESIVRERIGAYGFAGQAGACPMVRGRDLRVRLSVRAAACEMLGETAFDLEGTEGSLPAPLVSVLTDAAASLRDIPQAASLAETASKNRDAEALDRQLFGADALPMHREVVTLRRPGATQ